MNKYCKIYKNKKKILFIIDTESELQYIKEVIYLNNFDENINNPHPEILFLKSNFSTLLNNFIIYDQMYDYLNKFGHIIVNLEYCINIQILSTILKHKSNISTHCPVISNNLELISYKHIYDTYTSYDIKNIHDNIEIKKNMINYYLNDYPIINCDDVINKSIYENYYKTINLKSIEFRDNLSSIEREIIHYILSYNIQEITCLELNYILLNKFHISLGKQIINNIKIFIESYAYNNTLLFFIPKSYTILNTTVINTNLLILSAVFLNNMHIILKNDKIYFSAIPIIFYSMKTFYQYNLTNYINICIEYLMNKKPIKFENIPLEYEHPNIKIFKEKKSIKIVSLYENNTISKYFPKYNEYKTLKKFHSIDSKLKYINNTYYFSKPISNKYYINYNKLSNNILYKNSTITLFDLTNNCEFYTTEHLKNTLSFIKFMLSVKFIEYLHSKNLLNYRDIIFNYFATFFNNIEYQELGLIFPYENFYNEDLYKIFNNYVSYDMQDLILFYNNIINNYNITQISSNIFWDIISTYAIEVYINFLKKIIFLSYKNY